MKKFSVLSVMTIAVVTVLLVSACGVNREDYDAAQAKITKLTGDNATLTEKNAQLTGQVADLQAQVEELKPLEARYDDAQEALASYEEIICDQPWDEPWNNAMMNFPFAKDPSIPESLWYMVSVTQWSHDPNWLLDEHKAVSVLLFDQEGDPALIMDAVRNCVIVNPEVYPFFGQ